MERTVLGKARSSSVQGLAVSGQRTVYLSGLIAHNDAGEIIGPGSLETQCRYIFDKMAELMSEAGGSLANIVKITAFLTSFENYKQFLEVRGEYLGATPPASSTVRIAGLTRPEALIEIEAIGVLD